MKIERGNVEKVFLGKDSLPISFEKFLQELERIEKEEIDPVAFNKCKKEVQNLIADWIEMCGGLLFSKLLFEFESEFIPFAEHIYQELKVLEKRFEAKRFEKIRYASTNFLRQARSYPPISEMFRKTVDGEIEIIKFFLKKEDNEKEQVHSWCGVKRILNITPEFEEAVALQDYIEEQSEHEQKLLEELYVEDAKFGLVPKSYYHMQIPLDPRFRRKK